MGQIPRSIERISSINIRFVMCKNRLCIFLNVCYVVCIYVFSVFFCYSSFSFFLLLLQIYYVYCYGLPALMGNCPYWHPTIAVIIVQLLDLLTWLINSLYLSFLTYEWFVSIWQTFQINQHGRRQWDALYAPTQNDRF